MRIALITSCVILVLGCSSKPTDKNTIDASERAGDNGQELTVMDSSLYDLTFLIGLRSYRGSIQLVGSHIIIDGDSVSFPVDIPVGHTQIFDGLSETHRFSLTLSKVNLTTLSYRFVLADLSDKVIEEREGNAVLTPMFFLGSESDEDAETGEGYMASEYWDTNNLSIRIGERDEQDRLRAKVQHSSLRLDECPILRTK